MMNTLASRLRDANHQLIEDGNVQGVGEFFDSKYVVHFGGFKKSGHGAVRGFMKTIHDAFSNLSVDIEILVESDERISWQRTIRGTQTGKFHGFPASDKEIIWREMIVSEIQNGRIKEEWVVSDLAEALLRSRKR